MGGQEATFIKSATEPSQYPSQHLPEVAFAGRSNVGKSTLINTVLGEKRLAKTSSTPGCTQTLNFFVFQQRLSIVDLPGYGYAHVSHSVRAQWKTVVETYFQQRSQLRLVILLMDVRRDPSEGDLELLSWLQRERKTVLVVLTKIDKLSRSEQKRRHQRILAELQRQDIKEVVLFSAKTGEGKNRLRKILEGIEAEISSRQKTFSC